MEDSSYTLANINTTFVLFSVTVRAACKIGTHHGTASVLFSANAPPFRVIKRPAGLHEELSLPPVSALVVHDAQQAAAERHG